MLTSLHRLALAATLLATLAPGEGQAGSGRLIGSYIAFISAEDLYNSQGERLTAPWQVLRQDRANYHHFGVAQPGDAWDPYFGSPANRAALERMVRDGWIEPAAGWALLRGGVMVEVRIYGRQGVGRFVEVDVVR